MTLSRCTGFTNKTDIGDGKCRKRSYDLPGQMTICICITSMCNYAVSSCKESNKKTQVHPPPAFSPVIRTLKQIIKCSFYLPPGIYSDGQCNALYWQQEPPPFNVCQKYFEQNSVLCQIQITKTNTKEVIKNGYTNEETSYYAINILRQKSIHPNAIFGETITSTIIQYKEDEGSYVSNCLCTTNNCNKDFEICANGLKYNKAWV
ncbi:unnamed protein product [Didymodactylos carnosus]|uniref:Uncharacterized protein n=1 Tax=Didymodactylos carnosus TaxID=1234261 RepID=A0A815BBF1_9BILA|nr:unnamed protein product [Didymodactylos carnosus]CAF1267419.1 unnamed protein product [Didymodactylos carnosus]CAF3767154.1 unnamed protein product [Didymodactylos carnosus]CAF4052064.1 unnamed protein product [Didymodactylos carnosus]